MAIGEYCNRDVVIAAPSVSILTAARLMSQYHVGDLVLGVLADNLRDLSRLVGFQNLREEGEREEDD
ncbi:hypothetical protein SAMN05216189_105912 [Pseudomonas delhiensis]|uniref:CBS domain-containing protein n=1 Tax=Pseudomonas delhiensis TaxID=366289 RepID=A0A239N6L1_9PSED|nr:hypothetical protein [Pseudomonas delhiensis]SDK93795.1 hypothetical protein SAMN05216189_105912 [Pseudomonas delhiensis]SNT50571.1 hypothetical protein SAMN06295949_13834 [Pseudomonas delhiensis]